MNTDIGFTITEQYENSIITKTQFLNELGFFSLNRLQTDMDTDGYCYKDTKAFENKDYQPCYIPENAEDLEDVFSFKDLYQMVLNFRDENPEYWKEFNHDELYLTTQMFEDLSWEFPSTYLDQLTQYD